VVFGILPIDGKLGGEVSHLKDERLAHV
jgi:hypothetical protein